MMLCRERMHPTRRGDAAYTKGPHVEKFDNHCITGSFVWKNWRQVLYKTHSCSPVDGISYLYDVHYLNYHLWSFTDILVYQKWPLLHYHSKFLSLRWLLQTNIEINLLTQWTTLMPSTYFKGISVEYQVRSLTAVNSSVIPQPILSLLNHPIIFPFVHRVHL